MAAALSLVVVIGISMLVTKVATVALVHTGMAHESARFQTRSALTGVGFPTKESDEVVRHPVRRRIVMWLMLFGNVGVVSAISTLVLSFAGEHTMSLLGRASSIVLGISVLAALAYSHEQGIVHRDIKPANVMVTPQGGVKVMDFGIARALADTAATMTQTQAVMGTARYLSPEQAQGLDVDGRSDLYSVGCLLYYVLPVFLGLPSWWATIFLVTTLFFFLMALLGMGNGSVFQLVPHELIVGVPYYGHAWPTAGQGLNARTEGGGFDVQYQFAAAIAARTLAADPEAALFLIVFGPVIALSSTEATPSTTSGGGQNSTNTTGG